MRLAAKVLTLPDVCGERSLNCLHGLHVFIIFANICTRNLLKELQLVNISVLRYE